MVPHGPPPSLGPTHPPMPRRSSGLRPTAALGQAPPSTSSPVVGVAPASLAAGWRSDTTLARSPTSTSPPAGGLPDAAADTGTVAAAISCGLFHSSLLVDGQLWLWGKGDGGRLGLGHENPAFVPTLNPNIDHVRQVALGGVHSVALTNAGEVFTWGYGDLGALGHSVYRRELLPKLVKGPWNEKICHIATSGDHTAAISESGALYTWGRDEGDGRLGLGIGGGSGDGGAFADPTKVSLLTVPIADVACCGFFTLALTKDGQLWSWGANSNFELGRDGRGSDWRPKPVPSVRNI